MFVLNSDYFMLFENLIENFQKIQHETFQAVNNTLPHIKKTIPHVRMTSNVSLSNTPVGKKVVNPS